MGEYMVKLYPSQIRYYDENPTVTFRLKKEEKERLKRLAERSGKSISRLVCETLLGAEKSDSELYKKGFEDGYNKAELDWKVIYFCSVCGELMYIVPESDSHYALLEYMDEHGECHKECHDIKQRFEL